MIADENNIEMAVEDTAHDNDKQQPDVEAGEEIRSTPAAQNRRKMVCFACIGLLVIIAIVLGVTLSNRDSSNGGQDVSSQETSETGGMSTNTNDAVDAASLADNSLDLDGYN